MTTIKVFMFLMLATHAASVHAAFQYLKLVQQWPGAVCNVVNNPCQRTPPYRFTIHGLWPDNFTFTGGNPVNIEHCSVVSYERIENPTLLAEMDVKWPDLLSPQNSTDQAFWQHEWNKHGSCATNLYDQKAYFALTLHLKDRFDILSVFRRNRMTIGTHSFQSVDRAITRMTGVTADFRCNQPASSLFPGAKQLKEVIICFDMHGKKPINCPQGQSCRFGRGMIFLR